jgi:hypothetical protein
MAVFAVLPTCVHVRRPERQFLLLKLHRSSRRCCNRQDAKGMIWLYRGASAPRLKAFRECVIRLFVFLFVVDALRGSDMLIYEGWS